MVILQVNWHNERHAMDSKITINAGGMGERMNHL